MAKWNKSETLLLLTLYEQYPFLYKSTDRNYTNKALRRQTLDEICYEIQKVKENVTVEDIKVKIKTLRSQLRKERKTIQNSSSNEAYVPTLWSYQHITFLDESANDDPADTSDTEPIKPKTTECIDIDHEENASEKSFNATPEMPVIRNRSDNFRVEATKAFEFAKSYAEEILQNRIKRKPETKEDIFTKYLCEQLKLIQSEDTYEDTTWKILQLVRESVRKDRQERKELRVDEDINSTSNNSFNSSNEATNRLKLKVRPLQAKRELLRISKKLPHF